MIMCTQAQDLIKHSKENKSSISMAKPHKVASTKQYAAQQRKAKGAPAPTVNVHQPVPQLKTATTIARQTQTKPVTVAPTMEPPATAQQRRVHRALQVKTGPALKAKKADKAVSMAASSADDDDNDKFSAACYVKDERIMLLLPEWNMHKLLRMLDWVEVLHVHVFLKCISAVAYCWE